MISISLCMIVKNEETTIARCLNSVRYIVDEIIIIDTGSMDQTKEICKQYTDKIYDFTWINDFSAARNYAYSFATKDYILWLDADDIIMMDDGIKLLDLKETLDPTINVVMMKYNTGIDIRGNVTFSYYRERLTKRTMNFKWKEPVHEYIETFGQNLSVDIGVTHGKLYQEKSDRNIRIYKELINRKIPLSARGNYYYARELKEHGRWKEAIKQFEKFLDSKKGWREDNISACNELSKCYMKIGDVDKGRMALYRSFLYDTPRAEICIYIGYSYQERNEYMKAIYWYNLILSLDKPETTFGFIQPDCWGYLPCIEMAVCYDRLGDIENARLYNDKALEIKPTSTQGHLNKKYFEEIDARKEKV